MDFIADSLRAALQMLLSLDPEVLAAVQTSLLVAVWSILLASLAGIPLGVLVGATDFPLKRLVTTLLNTLMALPTVVIGLLVYGFLSRQGPLGAMGLLFTPTAMIIGQSLLAIPIVANFTMGAVRGADPRILITARTLGAGPLRTLARLLLDIRVGVVAAVIAGFGRVIAEVGVAMMLGGNIRGYTRTMTTAIAMETSKGEFAFGLALGLVLMAVALSTNLFFNALQER
jgi:tungstate transport system permease protein